MRNYSSSKPVFQWTGGANCSWWPPPACFSWKLHSKTRSYRILWTSNPSKNRRVQFSRVSSWLFWLVQETYRTCGFWSWWKRHWGSGWIRWLGFQSLTPHWTWSLDEGWEIGKKGRRRWTRRWRRAPRIQLESSSCWSSECRLADKLRIESPPLSPSFPSKHFGPGHYYKDEAANSVNPWGTSLGIHIFPETQKMI